MSLSFPQTWQSLRGGLKRNSQGLVREFSTATASLDSLIQHLDATFSPAEPPAVEVGSLASLQRLYFDAAQRVLLDPLQQFERAAPSLRCLQGIEDYESGLENFLRQLPRSVEVSGREVEETLGPEVPGRWRFSWRRWQKQTKRVAVRSVVESSAKSQMLSWTPLEGRCLLFLAQTSLGLLGPWETFREEALRCLDGTGCNPRAFSRDRERWKRLRRKRRQGTERSLTSLEEAAKRSTSDLARSLLWRPNRSRKTPVDGKRLLALASYWARQRKAVAAQLDLEAKFVAAGRQAVQHAEEILDSLDAEHRDLLQELQDVADALRGWRAGDPNPFPPPKTPMVSAEERRRDWFQGMSAIARNHLPSIVETTNPKRAQPGWHKPWRRIEPLPQFLKALEQIGDATASQGLQEAEGNHLEILRTIERGREVVTYSLEQSREDDADLAREGIQNAIGLIEHQVETAAEVRSIAEASLVEATAVVFSATHAALEQSRFGLWVYLGRLGFYRSLRASLGMARSWTGRFFRWLWRVTRRSYRWCLVKIGWEPPPQQQGVRVHRSLHLGWPRVEAAREPNLPMIYKRLFRAEPVEDPRFLVGRDIEMQALAEAGEMWQKGRAVAVVLTGERGSGKTSMLNCSVLRLFQNSPVVRGQLSQRIRSREDMRAYLHGLLELPKDQDLISALCAQRRVVILEEVERAFLRTINGFEPVREFLHVVSRTSPETLWILSLNRAACKLLDRTVEFSQYFSHRIDAMRVHAEDLKNAILLRHNLSGLRLHFAPVPHKFPSLDPIRRSFGLLVDPRDFFFEWLHQQSEGVFRAAFDLWHRHIQGAEGGVLYVASPSSPDSESPLNDCSREDLFTLQAIRQHGSLTVAEHAEVFSSTTQASEMQIERLADREILEPEPNATGWRVSTEAGYLVRRALDAENLL